MDLLAFPDHSRVWIYASDTAIDDPLIPDLFFEVQQFTRSWVSHQEDLKATGGILHNRFLVLLVDEIINKPGGCSIDKSVHFIQQLGLSYNVDFFNRELLFYLDKDLIQQTNIHKVAELYEQQLVQNETLFFDNLVSNKKDFIEHWLKPLNESWIKRFI